LKPFLLAAALAFGVPLVSHAQVVIQTPRVVPAVPDNGDYWRHDNNDWRRREEYSKEAARADWEHSHCVRDFQNQEYCRK
jgi:hypothetical protein